MYARLQRNVGLCEPCPASGCDDTDPPSGGSSATVAKVQAAVAVTRLVVMEDSMHIGVPTGGSATYPRRPAH